MLITLRGQTSFCLRASSKYLHKYSETESLVPSESAKKETYSIINTRSPLNDDFVDLKFEKKSPLDKCTEDISHVAPYIKPTFNFAAYMNKSETLQELLKLGVNFHKLEQKKNFPTFIMGLNFEKDVKDYILFFHDRGLSGEDIATTITKNPYILKEDIENLKVRINYLLYKKFDEGMIVRILNRNPFWLMFSTKRIDTRLGYFQSNYDLEGNEVRALAVKQPKLITYNIKHIKLNQFALKEEMGFSTEDIKHILLNKPRTFMKNKENMLKTFDYIVNTMKVFPRIIVEWPEILTCREFRIKQRHLFLKILGRAQYDPKLPNYISLLTLVGGSDADFAVDIAKSSLQAFNAFLKTL